MKNSKFTETQMVKAIRGHENGRKAEEICRDLGIRNVTFYKWRQKYGVLEVSELKKKKESSSNSQKPQQLI